MEWKVLFLGEARKHYLCSWVWGYEEVLLFLHWKWVSLSLSKELTMLADALLKSGFFSSLIHLALVFYSALLPLFQRVLRFFFSSLSQISFLIHTISSSSSSSSSSLSMFESLDAGEVGPKSKLFELRIVTAFSLFRYCHRPLYPNPKRTQNRFFMCDRGMTIFLLQRRLWLIKTYDAGEEDANQR